MPIFREGTLYSTEHFWINCDLHDWGIGLWWCNSLRLTVSLHIGPYDLTWETDKRYDRDYPSRGRR